jgi:AcrR family transcriptional regulator
MSPRRAKAVGGRVGESPAAALREHLIDATEGLLASAPIAAITTRDIAHAAGVSDGVLYNYFEDKTELILAALLRRYEGLAARFDAALPEAGTATVEENLTAFGRGLLDLLTDSLPTVAGLLAEPVLFHRLFEEIHRNSLSPQYMQQRLVDYLRAEQELGRLPAGADPAPVVTLLMGSAIVLTLGSHLTANPDRAALAEQLGEIVVTIIRGMA